jgi:hypothetical protein
MNSWNGGYIHVSNESDSSAQVWMTNNSWEHGETQWYSVSAGANESWKRNGGETVTVDVGGQTFSVDVSIGGTCTIRGERYSAS